MQDIFSDARSCIQGLFERGAFQSTNAALKGGKVAGAAAKEGQPALRGAGGDCEHAEILTAHH